MNQGGHFFCFSTCRGHVFRLSCGNEELLLPRPYRVSGRPAAVGVFVAFGSYVFFPSVMMQAFAVPHRAVVALDSFSLFDAPCGKFFDVRYAGKKL